MRNSLHPNRLAAITKHGEARRGLKLSKEYSAWKNMKTRVLCPAHESFHRYGGRGITICERWIKSFVNFLTDMGRCPDGFSLDRIDANGNYEPSNCRWADKLMQHNNTRRNRFVSVDGVRDTVANHARRLGVDYNMLYRRFG